jgi:hypothetical protein
MYIEKIGFEFVDWIYLAQDTHLCRAVVNTLLNLLAS